MKWSDSKNTTRESSLYAKHFDSCVRREKKITVKSEVKETIETCSRCLAEY